MSDPVLNSARFSTNYLGKSSRYPSPFFDIGQTYLPTSIKQMFHWCRYYFSVNPLINAVIYKKAEYPVTDIRVDEPDQKTKEWWTNVIRHQLKLKTFNVEVGLDKNTYGNAYVQVFFPFKKHLKCNSCNKLTPVESVPYKFINYNFRYTCPHEGCGHGPQDAIVVDVNVKNMQGIRLIRWNPEYVSPEYNEVTGDVRYYLELPPGIKSDITVGRKHVIETLPNIYLKAVKESKSLLIEKDNFIHLKRPTIAQKDMGYGIPMLLPVMKDAYYMQILRKAQESIALGHIVPLKIIFPQASGATSDPFSVYSLDKWRTSIEGEINKWRQDCVAPDAWVDTQAGLVRADDIQEGAVLRNHLGGWSRVVKRWDRPLRDGERAYVVHARGLKAVSTPVSAGHPFYAARKLNNGNGHKLGKPEFIRAESLRAGDYVGFPTTRQIELRDHLDLAEYTPHAATDEWVYTDHYTPEVPRAFEYLSQHEAGDDREALLTAHGWSVNQYKVAQSTHREGRILRRVCRRVAFDTDLAWVAGLYAAEGNATRKQVLFSLHEDETEYIDKLNSFFAKTFGCKDGSVERRSEHGIQVTFSSTIAASFFHSLCPGDSRTKAVPDVFRSAPEAIAAAFLQGYFEGDGCFHDDGYPKKVTCVSSSLQLAEGIRHLLLSLHVAVGITRIPPADYLIMGKRGKSSGAYRLTVGGSVPRLRALFAGGTVPPPGHSSIGVFRDGYFWHRIQQVAQVELDRVIGFQTDQTAAVTLSDDSESHGTFCTWGMACANSNYVPLVPVPIGHEMIGGEGKALLLNGELEQAANWIIAGLHTPREFVFGGATWCQTPDTLVQTSEGLQTLEEMTPAQAGVAAQNTVVVSHQGPKAAVLGHNVGVKALARVRTRLGLEVNGSHKHSVYVLNKDLSCGFKASEDLAPGDRVAVRAGAELWPTCSPKLEFDWKPASARFDEVTIPAEMTPELARLLGYLVSEGSCVEDRRIGFGNTDQEVNQDFADCCEAVFGYRPKFHLNRGTNRFGKLPMYQAEISKRQAVEFLYSLGVRGYAAEKSVPPSIRRSPKALVAEFLRAYFEGDGGSEKVRRKQRVTATSASARLLQETQLLLLNMGVVSSRYSAPLGKSVGHLVIRSEYVDVYAAAVGFISTRKKAVLSERTPTSARRSTAHRIPYLKEALDEFRAAHFANRSAWAFEPVLAALDRPTYSIDEVAALVDRERSTIQLHIKSGALMARKSAPRSDGRYSGYEIAQDDLRDFLVNHGLGRRRKTPKSHWGYSYDKLSGKDLTFLQEKDPELARRVMQLAEDRFVWDEVLEVELLDVQVPMRDLTVDEANSYQGNGVISHNSGSNVSMRMVENGFLKDREDLLDLDTFVLRRVSEYLERSAPVIAFEKFKMADDLQRLGLVFNANQGMKVSDESLLEELGFDFITEEKRKLREGSKQIEVQKKMQVSMAQIQAEVARVQGAYPQLAAGSRSQPPTPATPQGTGEMESPLNAQQGGASFDLLAVAQRYATKLEQMEPGEREQTLQQAAIQSPELHRLIRQILMTGKGSQRNPLDPLQMPTPEVKPPRRASAV